MSKAMLESLGKEKCSEEELESGAGGGMGSREVSWESVEIHLI